jgi:hypothetical protein
MEEMLIAIVLFALGVGAAFLAYFAWQHVNISLGNFSAPVEKVHFASPAISTQA